MKTITVSQAVARTGFSRDRIYDLVHARAIAVVRPPSPKGRSRIFILEDSLDDWMTAHTRPAASTAEAPTATPAALDADREIHFDGPAMFS